MWLADKDDPVKTDARGRWTLDNVPAGDDVVVKVKLGHPDYIGDANWGGLQDEQHVTMKDLRDGEATIAMHRGLSATGTVTDSLGRPVAGAVVIWGDHPYWELGSQEVRTGEDGVYRLPPLPPGVRTVTVVARGWMPQLRKVDVRPAMGPANFRLEPGKELRLRFVDGSGATVPGVSVQVEKWRGGESLYNHKHPNVLDTEIPRAAGEDGRYAWTWAPDDAVTYQFWKKGYARQEAGLVADGREQTVTLERVLRISATVNDAATGRPIQRVTAIPVVEFSPLNMVVERNRAKDYPGRAFTIELDRKDAAHRVRVEAEGYRTAMSDAYRVGDPDPTVDFRLDPAPPAWGRLVDAGGRSVAGAKVSLATVTQVIHGSEQGNDDLGYNQRVITDADGLFSFPAQFERYTVVATHDDGYAEATFMPDQAPGTMTLAAWARVEGRLSQAGKPVPSEWVLFGPLRPRTGTSPRIQDNLSAKTDGDGRFVFPRVPPLKSKVEAILSVWRDSPLTSSRSVPLDLRPGEHATVDLGGGGASVTGRVVPKGADGRAIDLNYALNWLIRKAPGIEPPDEIRGMGFDPRDAWSGVRYGTAEGHAYLDTLDHFFVKLDREGRFRVGGVPAGEYELAIQLYEPPKGGCLVDPIGSKVKRLRVTEAASGGAGLNLGDIEVDVSPGPRPGEAVPDLAFATATGATMKLGDLRGRYVLLDFWATWCGACVNDLPAVRRLHETHRADGRLVVLGLNLDEDPDEARKFVGRDALPWMQGFLGESPRHLGPQASRHQLRAGLPPGRSGRHADPPGREPRGDRNGRASHVEVKGVPRGHRPVRFPWGLAWGQRLGKRGRGLRLGRPTNRAISDPKLTRLTRAHLGRRTGRYGIGSRRSVSADRRARPVAESTDLVRMPGGGWHVRD